MPLLTVLAPMTKSWVKMIFLAHPVSDPVSVVPTSAMHNS